jgi:hypothetical protein
MDRSLPLRRRQHSRKALSSSVLPPCPELDITRPRSGIRHFSNLDSIDEGKIKGRSVSAQYLGPNSKSRSVSAFTAPMKWKRLFGKKGDSARGMYPTLEDPQVKHQRALQALRNFQSSSNTPYPYPQHIPPAAAHVSPFVAQNTPTTMTPVGYLMPAPSQHNVLRSTPISMEKIAYIASGIAIAIGVLFTWIFRFEVLKYGGVASLMLFLWKLGQWQSQMSLHFHRDSREVDPTQKYIISPQVPGSW